MRSCREIHTSVNVVSKQFLGTACEGEGGGKGETNQLSSAQTMRRYRLMTPAGDGEFGLTEEQVKCS